MGNNCCVSRNGGAEAAVYFPADLGDLKKKEDGKCIVAQKKAIRDCPKGHPLKAFVTPRAGYHCDACKRVGLHRASSLPAGTTLWACRSCSYDVCTQCRGAEEPDPDPPEPPEPAVQRFSFDLSDEGDEDLPNTELERIYERAFTNQRVVKCPFGVWAVRIDKVGLSDIEDDPSEACPPLVADYMDTKGATEIYEAFLRSLARHPPGEDGARHHMDIWRVHAEYVERFRAFDIDVFVCQWEEEQVETEQPEEEPSQHDRDHADGAEESAGSEGAVERAPPCQWVTFVDTRQAPNYVAEHCLEPPVDLPRSQETDEDGSSFYGGVKGGGGGAVGASGVAGSGTRGPGHRAAGEDCEHELEGNDHAGHDVGRHAGDEVADEEESSCSLM